MHIVLILCAEHFFMMNAEDFSSEFGQLSRTSARFLHCSGDGRDN